MTIERILGTDTGKEAFGKTDRNFVAIETALNNVSGAASDITYDNTASQMTATNVQDAIDENKTQINSLEAKIGTIESQTIVENYLAAHNIPSTAKRGRLDVKLKGMSAVNLVKNGNFVNGTTGWSGSGCTLASVNNILSLTGNGSLAYSLLNSAPNARPYKGVMGNKIYVKATLKVTNSNCAYFTIYTNDGIDSTQGAIQNNPVQNALYTLSGLITLPRNNDYGIWILQSYADAATANGKTMEVQNFIGVNLTQLFGAGNEPTKEQCDLMFTKYFDGLQGASNIVVESIGKNAFNLPIMVSDFDYNHVNLCTLYKSGEYTVIEGKAGSAAFINSKLFKVKKNTNYTLTINGYRESNARGGMDVMRESDFSTAGSIPVSFGISDVDSATVVTFNTENNENMRVRFYPTGAASTSSKMFIRNIQIEEGTVATAYEPYKSTEVTYKTLDGQPITLHRLPNGVHDEITKDGKLIKRIAEYTLQASDISTLSTGSVNNDIVGILKKSNYKNYNVTGNTLALSQSVLINNFNSGIYANTLDSIGQQYNLDGTRIGLIVAKGAYSNLASAQAALTGYKVIYELAQSQIFDTNAMPLVAEPNGTVFITPTASPQPSVELSYPINLGAVVDGLIEGQKEIGERIDNLDKAEWITATLQNGWTGTLQYRKNQIGQIEIKGVITAGTIGGVIAQLPSGYYSTIVAVPILIYGNTKYAHLNLGNDGAIKIVDATNLTTGMVYFLSVVCRV